MIEYITGTLYSCSCGYKSLSAAGSLKHSKTKKCLDHTTIKKEVRFASEEDIHSTSQEITETDYKIKEIKEQNEYKIRDIKEQLEYKIKKQNAKIKELENANKRLQASLTKITTIPDEDDAQDEGTGIIYFIVDKDLPDRGKIGRTKNTDIKRLKARYSSFGNPDILCHWSADIKEDENTLKILLRDAGCMKSNTEMISNIPLAREVFYEFIET